MKNKGYKRPTYQFGIGTNPAVISRWITDIWLKHDLNDNGLLDKYEVESFLNEVLDQVGLQIDYNLRDLQKLFERMDLLTKDGRISKTDMKFFFIKMNEHKLNKSHKYNVQF